MVPPPPSFRRSAVSNPRRVTHQTETSVRGWGTYGTCNPSVWEAELLRKESAFTMHSTCGRAQMRGGSRGSVGVAIIAG